MPQKQFPHGEIVPEKEPAESARPRVALDSLESAKAYQDWRRAVPVPFRELVESAIMTGAAKVRETGLPRVDVFLRAASVALTSSQTAADVDPTTRDFIEGLRTITTNEGSADAWQMLGSADVPFATKTDLWQKHITPIIDYLAEQDMAPPDEPSDNAIQTDAAELEPTPDDGVPPPDSDEMAPSMDEMAEQKEGEPIKVHFTVMPFYGGYFRQNLFDVWDQKNLKWRSLPLEETEARPVELERLCSRNLSGRVRGAQALAIPLPYGWSPDHETLEVPGVDRSDVRLTEDADGLWRLRIDADGVFNYNLKIGKETRSSFRSAVSKDADASSMTGRLPKELENFVAESKTIVALAARARLIVKAVRDRLEYSNESAMNAVYRADPARYFERIWQEKKADCDVANTVAAAALRAAGIACRLATGHYVKAKDAAGNAIMTSGTGHAWLEVYDAGSRKWFRADATPKGDPTLPEERPDEQAESGEGDYGEKEAEIMSDEELEKLVADLEAKSEQGESKTEAQRIVEKFSAEAECSPEEAREVLSMFDRVREIKDEKGELIQRKLINAWKQLVHDRKAERREYEGPVRMSEGDELAEPAVAKIDIRAGERDPSGFERVRQREKREKLFGGLDVYLAVDLSVSMGETDPASGRIKAELQRDAVMLYADTLMQCAFVSRQAEGRLRAPLPIRLELVSFHGGVSVDLPLAAAWGPKEKVALYRALARTVGGGTPDDQALEKIEEKILNERAARSAASHRNEDRPPLEFVAAFLDGGSNDSSSVVAVLRRLRESGTVVYGYGMTKAAKPIKAIYAPNSSVLDELGDLAPAVADDTIAVFKLLHPEHVNKKR